MVIQLSLSEEMEEKLNKRTKPIGISNTAYLKILLAKDLNMLQNDLDDEGFLEGNLFNAKRDNKAEGIPISSFKKMLKM